MDMVGAEVKLLNDLGIEHTDEIGEGGVVIGNNGEYSHLLFSEVAEAHVIDVGDLL